MTNSWDQEKDEKSTQVKNIKSDRGHDIGRRGHEVGNGFFHPGSGDLRDPGGIEDEEGNEGLKEEFDEHIYYLIIFKMGERSISFILFSETTRSAYFLVGSTNCSCMGRT